MTMKWRAISAWPDPSVLFQALGTAIVKQRAAAGDGEAQYSLGFRLVAEADGGPYGALLGANGRSPNSDVGLALCTAHFPVANRTEGLICVSSTYMGRKW
jgi:hypothetical protein